MNKQEETAILNAKIEWLKEEIANANYMIETCHKSPYTTDFLNSLAAYLNFHLTAAENELKELESEKL